MKRLLLFSLAIVSIACTKTPEEQEKKDVPVSSVTLGQATAEMIIGETTQLTVMVLPNDATNKTVSWASSKQSVATVSSTGLVTAVSEGISTITASAGGKLGTCTVTVSNSVVAVSSVELDHTTLEVEEGETKTLVVTIKPENASDKTVVWTSSKEDIASVKDGTVTGVSEGEAIITAKAGVKSSTCTVTVKKKYIPVESITLSPSSISLNEGETATLQATLTPSNPTNGTITWESSDESITTVSDGIVTAKKEGDISVTAAADGKTASCPVHVMKVERSILEINALPDDAFVSTIEVLVVAKAKVGYIISDGTACIYVQSTPGSLKIGDKVKIRAVKNTRRGLVQLYNVQQLEIVSSNNPVSYPEPIDIGNYSSINTATTTFSQVSYVKMAGQLIMAAEDNNGLSYDLKFENIPAEQHSAHLQYPYDYQKTSDFYKGLAASIDKGISLEFTGFFFGIHESSGALYFIPTSMKKVVPEGCVDLGLSVFWSNHNVGAGDWGFIGGYYAWGEVEEKDYYGDNYKFYTNGQPPFKKYNTSLEYGPIDNKTRLDLEDDVAHRMYGGEWRMPTEKEIQELIDNCSCEYIADIGFNEQAGVKFTSRVVGYTDQSLFFPFSGVKAFEKTEDLTTWLTISSSEINPEEPFSHIYLSIDKKNSYPYYTIRIERKDTGMGRLAGHQTRGVRSH